MTPLGLDALDKQHWVEHQGPVPVCFDCRNPWPCPTSTLIQALRSRRWRWHFGACRD